MRIEDQSLRLRLEQRLVSVLSMDVDEPLSGLAQLTHGSGVPVDETARAPVPVHHPPQQQAVRIALERLFSDPTAQLGQGLDSELGSRVRALCARADLLASRAITERKRQGVDEDGFSGAGLTGQRGESRPKFEIKPVHNREIPNRQVQQHLRL